MKKIKAIIGTTLVTSLLAMPTVLMAEDVKTTTSTSVTQENTTQPTSSANDEQLKSARSRIESDVNAIRSMILQTDNLDRLSSINQQNIVGLRDRLRNSYVTPLNNTAISTELNSFISVKVSQLESDYSTRLQLVNITTINNQSSELKQKIESVINNIRVSINTAGSIENLTSIKQQQMNGLRDRLRYSYFNSLQNPQLNAELEIFTQQKVSQLEQDYTQRLSQVQSGAVNNDQRTALRQKIESDVNAIRASFSSTDNADRLDSIKQQQMYSLRDRLRAFYISNIQNVQVKQELESFMQEKVSQLEKDYAQRLEQLKITNNDTTLNLRRQIELSINGIQNDISNTDNKEKLQLLLTRINSLKSEVQTKIDAVTNVEQKQQTQSFFNSKISVIENSLKEKLSKTENKEVKTTPEEQAKLKRDAIDAKKAELNKQIEQTQKQLQDLLKLRVQLQNMNVVDVNTQAEVEVAVEQLSSNGDISNALSLQKELLNKSYQKGDRQPFKKLGELLEKQGNTKINTYVNGKTPTFEVEPFIENGSTLIPIRAISEALQSEVKWDGTERKVNISKNGNEVILYIDKNIAYVNGQEKTLEVAPKIVDGSTFLPLRFISENLNANVEWQPQGQVIIIEDKSDVLQQ
jgi:hypothetical protein